jgi:hypothetical protein
VREILRGTIRMLGVVMVACGAWVMHSVGQYMDIEEIYKFLIKSQGIKRNKLTHSTDLCSDLGIDGDDFSMLMEEFASTYKVDMDNYRWYFHHGEEGWNIGGIFSPTPDRQVKHIPVTP